MGHLITKCLEYELKKNIFSTSAMKCSVFLIAYLIFKLCIAHVVRNIFFHGTLAAVQF